MTEDGRTRQDRREKEGRGRNRKKRKTAEKKEHLPAASVCSCNMYMFHYVPCCRYLQSILRMQTTREKAALLAVYHRYLHDVHCHCRIRHSFNLSCKSTADHSDHFAGRKLSQLCSIKTLILRGYFANLAGRAIVVVVYGSECSCTFWFPAAF